MRLRRGAGGQWRRPPATGRLASDRRRPMAGDEARRRGDATTAIRARRGDDDPALGRATDASPASPDPGADPDPRTSPTEDQRDPVRGLRVGARTPVRAEVRVTIGWDVLAGFSDRPAELEGHGPIPAEMGRRLAGDPDSWWRRLLTDPVTGTASHLDARRYRPPVVDAGVRARPGHDLRGTRLPRAGGPLRPRPRRAVRARPSGRRCRADARRQAQAGVPAAPPARRRCPTGRPSSARIPRAAARR